MIDKDSILLIHVEIVIHRPRNSPYPMISYEDAFSIIQSQSELHQRSVETAQVNASLVGYVLAETVRAMDPIPYFRSSIVDGYAVICPFCLIVCMHKTRIDCIHQ